MGVVGQPGLKSPFSSAPAGRELPAGTSVGRRDRDWIRASGTTTSQNTAAVTRPKNAAPMDSTKIPSVMNDRRSRPGVTRTAGNQPTRCRAGARAWQSDQVRVAIRVRPGSSRTVVGGSHDGALVIKVGARAVDGRATAAALRALAAALGIRHRDVLLISGATSRSKVVEIPDGHQEQVAALLAG